MAPPAANIIVTNDGAIADLNNWRTQLNLASVGLYVNNYTPVRTSVPANFTEATFVGYARQTVLAFGVPFLNLSGKAETDSAVLTWTYTAGAGSALVYGWFMLDPSGIVVLAATRFVAPVSLTPGSPTLSRQIQLTAVSEL